MSKKTAEKAVDQEVKQAVEQNVITLFAQEVEAFNHSEAAYVEATETFLANQINVFKSFTSALYALVENNQHDQLPTLALEFFKVKEEHQVSFLRQGGLFGALNQVVKAVSLTTADGVIYGLQFQSIATNEDKRSLALGIIAFAKNPYDHSTLEQATETLQAAAMAQQTDKQQAKTLDKLAKAEAAPEAIESVPTKATPAEKRMKSLTSFMSALEGFKQGGFITAQLYEATLVNLQEVQTALASSNAAKVIPDLGSLEQILTATAETAAPAQAEKAA